ncbi:glycosyltransferase family 2 protein [Achromobacter sp. ES-001]|uniref:glycosyltransferase family 2 protein n=1 Tax=Achromobacter sp. ES-001 TaxID=2860286 RepID=UPI001C640FE7|nr:glycosyltransferase family 2 protein [Achromobacter sp. ES-001]QYJ21511.1 glycosyltransferase family 2 protein [Achromobacter sp. ES-001]
MSERIAILLCTYQGEKYLASQLDSFAAQTHTDWVLAVSDDGSVDRTRAMLADYRLKWGASKLNLYEGPRRGFVGNFLSLTCNAQVQADYYSFSDQDDIWHAEKLEHAMEWLRTVPSDTPALYCTRTLLVNEENRPIGLSPLFQRRPAFENALAQNIAGGNTMVFNNAARQLLLRAGPLVDVAAHDWWVYLAVTACGGQVKYDSRPSLRYRQHNSNLIGANRGLLARLTRIRMLFKGHLKEWNARNIEALGQLRSLMTPPNVTLLSDFIRARDSALFGRIRKFRSTGIYRQTALGNFGMLLAVIFNKL